AGVRNLEREIAAVCRKVARRRAEGHLEPVRVTPDLVTSFLGAPKFEYEELEERTRVPGVTVGLVWTPAGGDILFIEATRMKGKGIAAHRAGIRTLILPKRNEKHLNEDVPDDVRQVMTIHLVDSVRDVVRLALEKAPARPEPSELSIA